MGVLREDNWRVSDWIDAMVGCKFDVASHPGRIGLTVYTYINKNLLN